ncbi:hypothetical protein [Tunicatimonas pelagia]|uniref:hypothetical protein n=1 Tax=Tunicatimonas pelagia TaxID=931531 RepID=UPI0026660905|nr:hypothetical protein [Tunicatimonas pelagia]WKN42575.1 hypothetical protein P0M28_26415 [Tunicatimonas pelagia]
MRITSISCFLVFISVRLVVAQEPWSVASYPDKPGYQQRIAPQLSIIANQPFGKKSKAFSKCPDTGLPVYTWALEGETIVSPYTGRTYQQGETGYFGPKERGEDGQIIRFGGDPLKRDLLPATARLLLNPNDTLAKAYLSIPGNLQQQYHFAAKNWARFYPLLADRMGEDWKNDFQQAVATYAERQRPSDGVRQYPPLSVAHNLVGEPGKLLGGNKQDGGTENHKTMWRTSGLLYAQLFPEGSQISSYPAAEAEQKITFFLQDYLRRMLTTGNGEYDSQIYYPHSIESYLNLYDFSPNPETRAVAKLTLDYYLATYALKSYGGAIAGVQKRGGYGINGPSEMRQLLHTWFGSSSGGDEPSSAKGILHQATSTYRPNQVIWNLFHKNIETPFELKVARPSYHMDQPNTFQEYFYGSKNFGLGSVYLTKVDNPNQQIVWSLVALNEGKPLTFGGLQPYHRSPGGNSPYTQTLQHQNAILVASAPTEGEPNDIASSRQGSFAREPLRLMDAPKADSFGSFLQQAKYQAATWLFVPEQVNRVQEQDGRIFIDVGSAFVAVSPFSPNYYWLDAKANDVQEVEATEKKAKHLYDNQVLVVPGMFSGYALEVVEKKDYTDFSEFISSVIQQTQIRVNTNHQTVQYQPLSGTSLEMRYQANELRCTGSIDGKPLKFENWTSNGGYESPYITTGNGKMTITDGKEGYSVDYSKFNPVYKKLKQSYLDE